MDSFCVVNTKRQAITIMKDVAKKEISAGKDPMGLAATVLYLSCLKTGEERTNSKCSGIRSDRSNN
jgi:transcription initiation factor TFIIIB Brf1 subunit/transcription initiation factor TFIIB